MAQISLAIPQSQLPNSSEDPKVASDLTILQTLLNGNLDATNLLTTSGIMHLTYRTTSTSTTAAVGEWIHAGPGVGVNVPSPTANTMIAVSTWSTVTGANPVTIGTGTFWGAGLDGGATFLLGIPGVHVLLLAQGAGWFIHGQQDTGWVPLTLGTNVSSLGGYTPSARLIGDRVWLKGGLTNSATINNGVTWATVPAGMHPASTGLLNVAVVSGVPIALTEVQTNGTLIVGANALNGAQFPLDGASYTLT